MAQSAIESSIVGPEDFQADMGANTGRAIGLGLKNAGGYHRPVGGYEGGKRGGGELLRNQRRPQWKRSVIKGPRRTILTDDD